jgi:hypothetical protein
MRGCGGTGGGKAGKTIPDQHFRYNQRRIFVILKFHFPAKWQIRARAQIFFSNQSIVRRSLGVFTKV